MQQTSNSSAATCLVQSLFESPEMIRLRQLSMDDEVSAIAPHGRFVDNKVILGVGHDSTASCHPQLGARECRNGLIAAGRSNCSEMAASRRAGHQIQCRDHFEMTALSPPPLEAEASRSYPVRRPSGSLPGLKPYLPDQLGQLFWFVAVVAAELDELSGLGEHRTALGGSSDVNSASAAEVK